MKKIKPETIVFLSMFVILAKYLHPIVMKPFKEKERKGELLAYGELFVKERPEIVAVDGKEYDESMTIFYKAKIGTDNSDDMKVKNKEMNEYFQKKYCKIGMLSEKPTGYILNVVVDGNNARLLDGYFRPVDCKASGVIVRGAHN